LGAVQVVESEGKDSKRRTGLLKQRGQTRANSNVKERTRPKKNLKSYGGLEILEGKRKTIFKTGEKYWGGRGILLGWRWGLKKGRYTFQANIWPVGGKKDITGNIKKKEKNTESKVRLI